MNAYYNIKLPFYCFLLPICGREKSCFLGQYFVKEILMDLNVLTSPNSENHIFSGLSECETVISKIQKLIVAETSNLVLYIFITCRCHLQHFIKIEQKLCVQGYTKEF